MLLHRYTILYKYYFHTTATYSFTSLQVEYYSWSQLTPPGTIYFIRLSNYYYASTRETIFNYYYFHMTTRNNNTSLHQPWMYQAETIDILAITHVLVHSIQGRF